MGNSCGGTCSCLEGDNLPSPSPDYPCRGAGVIKLVDLLIPTVEHKENPFFSSKVSSKNNTADDVEQGNNKHLQSLSSAARKTFKERWRKLRTSTVELQRALAEELLTSSSGYFKIVVDTAESNLQSTGTGLQSCTQVSGSENDVGASALTRKRNIGPLSGGGDGISDTASLTACCCSQSAYVYNVGSSPVLDAWYNVFLETVLSSLSVGVSVGRTAASKSSYPDEDELRQRGNGAPQSPNTPPRRRPQSPRHTLYQVAHPSRNEEDVGGDDYTCEGGVRYSPRGLSATGREATTRLEACKEEVRLLAPCIDRLLELESKAMSQTQLRTLPPFFTEIDDVYARYLFSFVAPRYLELEAVFAFVAAAESTSPQPPPPTTTLQTTSPQQEGTSKGSTSAKGRRRNTATNVPQDPHPISSGFPLSLTALLEGNPSPARATLAHGHQLIQLVRVLVSGSAEHIGDRHHQLLLAPVEGEETLQLLLFQHLQSMAPCVAPHATLMPTTFRALSVGLSSNASRSNLRDYLDSCPGSPVGASTDTAEIMGSIAAPPPSSLSQHNNHPRPSRHHPQHQNRTAPGLPENASFPMLSSGDQNSYAAQGASSSWLLTAGNIKANANNTDINTANEEEEVRVIPTTPLSPRARREGAGRDVSGETADEQDSSDFLHTPQTHALDDPEVNPLANAQLSPMASFSWSSPTPARRGPFSASGTAGGSSVSSTPRFHNLPEDEPASRPRQSPSLSSPLSPPPAHESQTGPLPSSSPLAAMGVASHPSPGHRRRQQKNTPSSPNSTPSPPQILPSLEHVLAALAEVYVAAATGGDAEAFLSAPNVKAVEMSTLTLAGWRRGWCRLGATTWDSAKSRSQHAFARFEHHRTAASVIEGNHKSTMLVVMRFAFCLALSLRVAATNEMLNQPTRQGRGGGVDSATAPVDLNSPLWDAIAYAAQLQKWHTAESTARRQLSRRKSSFFLAEGHHASPTATGVSPDGLDSLKEREREVISAAFDLREHLLLCEKGVATTNIVAAGNSEEEGASAARGVSPTRRRGGGAASTLNTSRPDAVGSLLAAQLSAHLLVRKWPAVRQWVSFLLETSTGATTGGAVSSRREVVNAAGTTPIESSPQLQQRSNLVRRDISFDAWLALASFATLYPTTDAISTYFDPNASHWPSTIDDFALGYSHKAGPSVPFA